MIHYQHRPETNPPSSSGGSQSDVTRLLHSMSRGSKEAGGQLLALLYDELRRLASSFMVRERAGHTLQPTALVHEAYLRLARETGTEWQGRAHFLAIAATAMRRVLVDHARARGAAKRGGGKTWVTLHEELAARANQPVDVLALDEALTRLSIIDERQGKVVELRFFGGLEIRETAQLLKVSEGTVKRDWRHAKAWLRRELSA